LVASAYRRAAVVAVVCASVGVVAALAAGRSWGVTVVLAVLAGAWGAGCWWWCRHAAESSDHQTCDQVVETDVARAQAAGQAHSLWAGLLHDEVAVAFRAAATAGVSRGEVRRSARDALAAIDAHLVDSTVEVDDLIPALRQVAAAAGTTVSVDGPRTLVAPRPVASAVLGAVTESVRNVERHAPGASVTITVTHDNGAATITVVDDGPGFVVDPAPAGGLRVSVADRMAHIDGSAQVTSTPGEGTTVRLTWPVVPAHADQPAGRRLAVPALMMLVAAGALVGPVGAYFLDDRASVVLALVCVLVAGVATSQVVRCLATTVTLGERGRLDQVRHVVVAEVHTRRRARLDDLVVPLLHQLAASTPIDDDLRAEAVLAEQAVRDEMHLPEVLDTPTRGLVRAARANGCRIRLQSDAQTVGAAQINGTAQVNAVLAAALSVSPAPRELTVSVYNEDAHDTVAVVAVPRSAACRDALHEAFADRTTVRADDEDATWVEIRLLRA